MTTLRLGLFASHGGSNLQAILDGCSDGTIKAEPAVVISNNSKSKAFERARAAGIPTVHLSSVTHPDPVALDHAMHHALVSHGVTLVALAGYMRKLGPVTIDAYRGRILNIHPALLPRHGGKGLFGSHVHQSVLDAGDTESGPTVHLVDEHYDHGATITQAKVPVHPDDTIETLAARVLEQEHRLYVETLARIASGELLLPD